MTSEEYQAMLDDLKRKDQQQKTNPDLLQSLYRIAQRVTDNPLETLAAAGSQNPLATTNAQNPERVYDIAQGAVNQTLPEPTAATSEITKEMGAEGGRTLDQLFPHGFTPVSPGTVGSGAMVDPNAGPSHLFENVGSTVGKSVPNMLTTAPLLAIPYAGLPLAVAKSEMEGYGPNADPISGLASGLGMAGGAAAVPAGANLLGNAAKSWLLPSAGELAGAESSQAFGNAAAGALQTAVDPASAQLVNAARLAGGVAGGTVAGEIPRQTESLMREGKLSPITPESALADVGTNLAFAVPHMQNMLGEQPGVVKTATGPALEDPYSTTGMLVNEASTRVKLAQEQRNQTAKQQEEYDAQRGTRIAQAHQDIFNSVATGDDPTPAIGALKAHWDEAEPVPTPAMGLQVVHSMSDDANQNGITDDMFQRVVAGVQGRYNDAFKSDPTLPGPDTVNELVKRGLLPKITLSWINENFSDALDQTLGNVEDAKTNLINRISAHYEERLPGAMEAMRGQVVPEGLSKQALSAQTEADKDAAYMQAIIKLHPFMKTAKAPDGSPLDQALFARDMDMSAATQGSQLQSSSKAWAKYDAWKNAVIKMADTYDPQTRQGTYLPTKRLSDGTMIELPAQKASIEDMVAKKDGRYTFDVTPTRKHGRAGSSSALNDAVEFVNDKFGEQPQEEDDIREDPEGFVQQRKALLNSSADEELSNPDLPAIEADADEQGLTGKDKEDYVAAQQQPALGADLQNAPETHYDVALHLMNKVDKLTNAELWEKYGGEKIFGKGAKSPGKFQLFKDAIMAKMESAMDDTGKLSVAQKTFYDKWKQNVADKTGGQVTQPKTWEEQRAQFNHALRLYWGTHNPVSMQDLFMSMLEDKPQYQKLLRGGGSAQSMTGTAIAPTQKLVYNDLRTPLVDAVRLGTNYARSLGVDPTIAQEQGVLLGKAVQVLDEVAGYGQLVTNSPSTLGLNAASKMNGGPVVGVNIQGISRLEADPMRALVKMLTVTAHELAHNYSDHNIGAFGPYKKARMDAYAGMRGLFENLGPQATDELLNDVLPQVLLPPNLQGLPRVSLQGQDFGQESVSRFMELVMVGALTKDNPWQTALQRKTSTWGDAVKWLPDEIQAGMHLALRDMANVLGAVKQYYKARPYQKGDIKVMNYIQPLHAFATQFLDTNVEQLRQYRTVAMDTMAKLTLAGSTDWADPTIVQTVADMQPTNMPELIKASKVSYSKTDPKDLTDAQQLMFGGDQPFQFEHEKRLGVTVPPWSRYAGLFFQALRRYQKSGQVLANDAMRLTNDLEPSYFRLTRLMHDPFFTTDSKGRLVYDDNNPVLAMVQNKSPDAVRGRKAMNELYLWANEHATPVVIKDQSGKVTVNQAAAPIVNVKIGHLPMSIQQGVLQGLSNLVDGYKQAADIAYHAQVENTGVRLAGLFMSIDKGMYYDGAFQIGKQVAEASVAVQDAQNKLKLAQKQTPLLAQQALAASQQAIQQFTQSLAQLNTDQVGAVNQYMFGNDGLAQKLLDLNEFFAKRQDWFGSETRPGKIFIVSKMPDGITNHYTSAQNESAAKKVMKELAGQGHTDFQFVDKAQRKEFDLFQSPDAVVENFQKLEQEAWKTFLFNMKEKLSPEDAEYLDKLGYVPGAASEKYIQNKAVERYMRKRELLPGRERLDALEVFQDYTGRMSGSVARRSLRQQIDLLKKDPRTANDGQFKQTIEDAMNSLMTPINEKFVAARAGMTAYFLGMPNLVGPIIEGTQSSTTILPYLVDEAGFANGVKAYSSALVKPGMLRGLGQDFESKRLLQSAKDKDNMDPRAMTKDEATALYYKRANDEGAFQYGPIYSATLSRDHHMLTQQAFGMGITTPKTRDQLITDPIYWLAQKSMYLYSHLSAYNSRIAFLAALDIQYDKGLRGTELYQSARAFQNVSTFGGGKANSLGFVSKLSNPNTRSAFSLIESLQRYTFGQATMFKDMVADVIGNTDLPPQDRVRAAKALGTATLAQFLLGGAMAIPGMAIGAGIIKAITGYDSKQELRNLWFHLTKSLGADDPMAVTTANYAQNGLVSNALGVDLSNRVSNNSILGFNQYNGFDASGIFGATGGIVQKMVDSVKYVAQGEMVQAGKSLAPPSWAPYFDLATSKAKYGDLALRDQSNRKLLDLSPGQAATYALGLRPQKYRQIRDQQEALKASEDKYSQVRDAKLDDLSQQLLQGNTNAVWDHIQSMRAQDPTIQPQGTARSVIDRAVQSTQPQDLLAQGAVGNDDAQKQIAATFGDVAPRQSEVDGLILRQKLNAQLGGIAGQPATRKDFEHAAMIDALVDQKGLTRGEAERLVTLMGY